MPIAYPSVLEILESLHIEPLNSGACYGEWIAAPAGEELDSFNPASDEVLAKVRMAGPADYEAVMAHAAEAFLEWRMVPAPQRGAMVREIGDELRAHKAALGALVTLEMGKILPEGLGEVQEMIDIADFAVGLSRQLYGLTMHSERPGHRMYEQWHPLGIVGVISAFNFPVAVWSWNALDCGGVRRLRTVAAIFGDAADRHRGAEDVQSGDGAARPEGDLQSGDRSRRPVAETLVQDGRIPLVSFTGSTEVGRHVSEAVARRLGRSIAGIGRQQRHHRDARRRIWIWRCGRCCSARWARRDSAAPPRAACFWIVRLPREMTEALIAAYRQVKIGDPMEEATLMGPLVNRRAVDDMMDGLRRIREQGGEVLFGGGKILGGTMCSRRWCARGRICRSCGEEIFAPILYLVEFDELDEAIHWHNDVPQGLSSAMFTAQPRSPRRRS